MAAALRRAIRKTEAMSFMPDQPDYPEEVLVPEPVIEELAHILLELDKVRFDDQDRIIVDDFDEHLKTFGKHCRRVQQDNRPAAIDMLPDGKLIDGPMVDRFLDGPMF
jgi:hypothetical protein